MLIKVTELFVDDLSIISDALNFRKFPDIFAHCVSMRTRPDVHCHLDSERIIVFCRWLHIVFRTLLQCSQSICKNPDPVHIGPQLFI